MPDENVYEKFDRSLTPRKWLAIVSRMLPNLYASGQAGGLGCLLVLGVSLQDVMGEPIYQYKDKDGVMHFSNVPTDPRYRTVIATDRVQDSGAPAVASQPVAALSSQLNETSASRSGDSVYQYVDRNGLIHFTNVPTSPRYKKIRGQRAFTQLQPKRLSPALHQTITQTSLVYRMNPALVRAVIQAESAYDPDAVSPKGAMGLMQLMPEMAWSLNVANPYDPKQNITGGVRHLRYLLDRFGGDRKSTRLNSSHSQISYAVFCLKKKKKKSSGKHYSRRGLSTR